MQGPEAVFTHEGMLIEMTNPSGNKASIIFICLPETMDPSGPKER
jgi:hypothetical protein